MILGTVKSQALVTSGLRSPITTMTQGLFGVASSPGVNDYEKFTPLRGTNLLGFETSM